MTKNCIMTVTIGDHCRRLASLTHPSIKAYASRINCDFVAICDGSGRSSPHWEKFALARLLGEYDRVLYVDTDVIIRDDATDVFDEVPEDCLGMFNEAPFTDRSKELLIDCCKAYGVTLPGWDGRYFNTGVMVVPRVHAPLFELPALEYCSFYEQTFLNMRIAQMTQAGELKVHPLHHRWNRMSCMDAPTGEDRHASYVIHYAGCPSQEVVLDLIPRDLSKWKDDAPGYRYKRHVHVSCNGGLGDQAQAEPAIRHLVEKVYPDDDLVVTTHWPELFRHLGVPVFHHGEAVFTPDAPYRKLVTLPEPDSLQWSVVSNLMCHTIDYTSIALAHKTLPVDDKRIKLEFDEVDLGVPVDDLYGAVAIHAGRHWPSKTFPLDWWQAVVDGIAKDKLVILIGFDDGNRGVWDLACPIGAVDLRNKLDLNGLICLLSKCGTLVSNDSAPIHLAGAFDGRIILIPSCKHPGHLLPWRHGSQSWGCKAMYRRLVLDDVESAPTQVYETRVEAAPEDWSLYLPDAEEVVKAVTERR